MIAAGFPGTSSIARLAKNVTRNRVATNRTSFSPKNLTPMSGHVHRGLVGRSRRRGRHRLVAHQELGLHAERHAVDRPHQPPGGHEPGEELAHVEQWGRCALDRPCARAVLHASRPRMPVVPKGYFEDLQTAAMSGEP